jgi:hypothetical protein
MDCRPSHKVFCELYQCYPDKSPKKRKQELYYKEFPEADQESVYSKYWRFYILLRKNSRNQLKIAIADYREVRKLLYDNN